MTEGGEVRREGKRERGMEGGRWEEGEKLTQRNSPGEGARGCRTEAAAEAWHHDQLSRRT